MGLAISHSNLGSLLSDTGRPQEAEAEYHRTLEVQEKLAADNPERPDFQLGVGQDLNRIGDVSCVTGQLPEAVAAFGRAASLYERLGMRRPRP